MESKSNLKRRSLLVSRSVGQAFGKKVVEHTQQSPDAQRAQSRGGSTPVRKLNSPPKSTPKRAQHAHSSSTTAAASNRAPHFERSKSASPSRPDPSVGKAGSKSALPLSALPKPRYQAHRHSIALSSTTYALPLHSVAHSKASAPLSNLRSATGERSPVQTRPALKNLSGAINSPPADLVRGRLLRLRNSVSRRACKIPSLRTGSPKAILKTSVSHSPASSKDGSFHRATSDTQSLNTNDETDEEDISFQLEHIAHGSEPTPFLPRSFLFAQQVRDESSSADALISTPIRKRHRPDLFETSEPFLSPTARLTRNSFASPGLMDKEAQMHKIGMISEVTAPFETSFTSCNSFENSSVAGDGHPDESLELPEGPLLSPELRGVDPPLVAILQRQLQLSEEQRLQAEANHERAISDLGATIDDLQQSLRAVDQTAHPAQEDILSSPTYSTCGVQTSQTTSYLVEENLSISKFCAEELRLINYERSVLAILLSGVQVMLTNNL